MSTGLQVSKNDVVDPERLTRILRQIVDAVNTMGKAPLGVVGNSVPEMSNMFDGISQPAQARLIQGINNFSTIKHNLDPSVVTNPAVSNDWTQGYSDGSIWINHTPGASNQAFMLVLTGYPTPGAAVWKQITV